MTDYIIIGIIAVVAMIGLAGTIKHFKCEGGCCGGGSSYKPRKKKLSSVHYQKTFAVEGMHCNHCKARVEEVVNGIEGVAAHVDLEKGLLTVSYAEDVPDDLIKSRIERAGYKANAIK